MTEPTLENRPPREAWDVHDCDVYEVDKMEEWFEGFEKKVRLLISTVCDECPFSSHCENYPYDCEAFDALKELLGKEAK